MDRFAVMLCDGLKGCGHEVRLLKPVPFIGRFHPSSTGFGKWLGYPDRFIFFRPVLIKAARWADIVHICDQANAMYIPWLKEKPHMVSCHDMLAIRSVLGEIPEHQTGLTGRIYQGWILSGLKRAMHVACVSGATRKDVLRITKLSPKNVSVVRNGLNYPYRPMSFDEAASHLEKMGLSECRPFFLHVGGDFWYKNRGGLLRIFAQMVRLKKENGNLVLAGAALPEILRKLAFENGISSLIKEIGSVSNEQLCALYSTAQGLIFPSLAEGFGWPIIEAQACGCPVFASNRKPMTEVGGQGAIYFDPEKVANAAEIINNSIKNRYQLIQRGFQNAASHTAENMIAGYITEYKQVLKEWQCWE
ncbi:MAG: glycosyltransferase family 4 protein [Syntrophaceae bacterium]|nr:glycosyltransferase family 4 protein [Syntrophaceae bacterium]